MRPESVPSLTPDDNRQSEHPTTMGGMRRHFDEETIAPTTTGRTAWSIIDKPASPSGINCPFSPMRYAHYDNQEEPEPYPDDRRGSFGTVRVESSMRDQTDDPDREHDDGRSLTPQPLRLAARNVSDPTHSHGPPSTVENMVEHYPRTGTESVWTKGRIETDRERTQRIMEGRRTWTSSVYTVDTRGDPIRPQEDRPPLTDEMVAQIDDHIKGRNREAAEKEVDWHKMHGEFK